MVVGLDTMTHNVENELLNVNTMNQDVNIGIVGSVGQADLAPMRNAARLGEYALIYRVQRIHQGGGYGDQDKHSLTWAVAVYVDGQLCRIFNARGAGREWNSLDRLSGWLREQGFWYWWTRNDFEPVGSAATDDDPDHPDPLDRIPPFP